MIFQTTRGSVLGGGRGGFTGGLNQWAASNREGELQRLALRSFVVRQLGSSTNGVEEFPWVLLVAHFCAMTQRISAAALEFVHSLRVMPDDPVAMVSLGAAYTAGWSSTALYDPGASAVLAVGVFQDHLRRRREVGNLIAQRGGWDLMRVLLLGEGHYNLARCFHAFAMWSAAEAEYLKVLELLEEWKKNGKKMDVGEISIRVAFESLATEMEAMTKFNLGLMCLKGGTPQEASTTAGSVANCGWGAVGCSETVKTQSRSWLRTAIIWE
eukprot:GDKK01023725.1.p1 GENE.GDKK01023725.1~~GDKK01023725.1.p1  ORF type:complete len:269 (+),score=45.97 GDKK01023725.1:2-808(+)